MKSAYVLWFEVACVFCGDVLTEVTLDEQLPKEKCLRCGGPVCFNGESRRQLKPMEINTDDLKPRKGRPPRWLVEQRKAAALT